MTNRPHSVTIIAWLFIAVGSIGLAYHLSEFPAQHRFDFDVVGICFVRLLAIISGVFMLRGFSWARWLLVVWMVYHVVLSAFPSLSEAAMHIVLFSVVGYLLFRPPSSTYFRGMRATTTQSLRGDEKPVP